jgi:uncharacterized protein (DUF983 family)
MHAMALPIVLAGMKRGFLGRCPQCGEGRLLHHYLKVEATCPVCAHDNGQYPADDAPPYFTILLVGHLALVPLLVLPFIFTWPIQWVLLTVLSFLAGLTLWLLPRVKGAVIGLQWALREGGGRVPGQEPDETSWRTLD